MSELVLRAFCSDDTDWLVAQHGLLYVRDEGFDETFAPLVRTILRDFNANHDPIREQGWIAEENGVRLGSVFCVALDDCTAKLRLFLVLPQARGKGLGKRLLAQCMSFARGAGYQGMRLWTHESHKAACELYARSGWQMVNASPAHSFGCDLVEQTWVYRF